MEEKKAEDRSLDLALRPKQWKDYIGQESIKNNLHILIKAALERKEPVEHLLFYGPAGLGKTTLAYLIAKEMRAQIKTTSGPAIERVGDLASLLTNLTAGDILFVDEAHRLNKMIEEVLYPAMETRSLDIIVGKGPGARSIQLELPPFTLIAATTRISLLSSPLRSRFSGGTFRLDYYSVPEIQKIIKQSAKVLNVELDEDASLLIADRSRFTPRTANRLLKRCRDYAQVHKQAKINKDIATRTLDLIGIDEAGLEETDRRILSILLNKFDGGPVGLQTLSAATSEEIGTIEEIHEPYLLRLGFIEKTPRGRLATPRAWKHLGLKPPQSQLI